MNEQLKELRKILDLTLDEFGARIGVTKATVSRWEKGERSISEQTIKLICSEFNINEEWLRTGKGNREKEVPSSEEVESYVKELLNYGKISEKNSSYEIIIDMMKTYVELDTDSQIAIRKYLKNLAESVKNRLKEQNQIDAKVQGYREELELEARQAEKSSVCKTEEEKKHA